MTTGFQQQHHSYSPILRTAARPQHMGAKLPAKREQGVAIPAEPRSFRESRLNE